jgi:hypothetical protein
VRRPVESKALRSALKDQYHAGLAMLDQCVERCPEEAWTAGAYPRFFWRIAFHAAFFTHNYLVQDEAAFNASFAPGRTPTPILEALGAAAWTQCGEVEPYELPESAPVLPREHLREYLRFLDSLIDPTVDSLDLEAPDSGFSWYPDIGKLSHQLMNLRHLQGHVGQLSELLMARGVDTDWAPRAAAWHAS